MGNEGVKGAHMVLTWIRAQAQSMEKGSIPLCSTGKDLTKEA